MAKDRRNIRFVRIRGRIVPIKIKRRKEGIEAAGLITAGTTLSVGGSAFSGSLLKRARILRKQGFFGALNIKALESKEPTLKSLGLRKNKAGRIIKIAGRKKLIDTSQLDFFQTATDVKSRKFHRTKTLKAFQKSFFSRKIFKNTNILSAALVGLGVERAISATGIEDSDNLLGDLTSEVAGVGSAFATESIARNVRNKIGKGESLRKGFRKDLIKGFKSLGQGIVRKKLKL